MQTILKRRSCVLQIVAAVLALVAFATSARADIFQWEYINPSDPSQGKRQSTTLAPDGAGVDAVPGADLSYRDLTMAYLIGADLSGASFSAFYPGPATVLTGADLSQAHLTNASFFCATLTDANFTDADVRGADFNKFYGLVNSPGGIEIYVALGTGITLAQLYSTGSYQEHDLRGVSGLELANAITTNVILPNGHIDGLNLLGSGMVVVRDYSSNLAPIPITVDQHLAMAPGGTLRMVFEADAWDSTISFAAGIPVTLGGTLELTFAADVDLASQLGRTLDLFDWTGVDPTGAFDVESPYTWDLTNLYTAGEVTLVSVPEPGTLILLCLGLGAVFPMRCNATRALRLAAMLLIWMLATPSSILEQQWLITSNSPLPDHDAPVLGTLWDYAQGSGAAVNPRS